MSERLDYLAWVEAQAEKGTPYCWPDDSNGYLGKGLQRPESPEALDCSGTVTCGLFNATKGRLDWRATHNAARLYDSLEPTQTPKPGDLAFYGRGTHVTHVMTVVGDGRVVGACGGNSHTLSVELARKAGARVKYRVSVAYRPDLVGFRSLPVD